MKHFYLIANRDKSDAVELAKDVEKRLAELGCVCTRKITNETECVLVLGGDGTLLQAVRDLRGFGLPFLGINMGTLGYLAEVDREHVEDALQQLIAGPVETETRMMLFGQVIRDGRTVYEDAALNDIVIGSRGLTVMHFKVYVNGEYLTTYQADGMVVASPTGSTAYNLSAGGPVVHPRAALLVLTPVSPHTLISRSIVLESNSVVELEMVEHPSRRSADSLVSLDGNEAMSLLPGDHIRISKSQETIRLVKYNKLSFLEALRMKMG
ncbi:MAG: NAD(+)/NADH kinase [Lachnospiraceae bacterium]|nr:NAD(+)/NADH kinase [Lachnospiraceae bacterium]